jgi:hypothetical protein
MPALTLAVYMGSAGGRSLGTNQEALGAKTSTEREGRGERGFRGADEEEN